MPLTLEELKERLKQLDETIVVELLQLESGMIVDKCEDIIMDKFNELEEQFEDLHHG